MDTQHVFALRGGKAEIEEGADFSSKFYADGLILAMAMDATTREPLMLAYMNEESLRRTLEIGESVYWSRSRKRLWRKGEESGHTQSLVDFRIDCDGDTVLLLVDQAGVACHTGRHNCFFNALRGGKLTPIAPVVVDPARMYRR